MHHPAVGVTVLLNHVRKTTVTRFVRRFVASNTVAWVCGSSPSALLVMSEVTDDPTATQFIFEYQAAFTDTTAVSMTHLFDFWILPGGRPGAGLDILKNKDYGDV